MTENFSAKHLILCCLVFALGLMTLLTLCMPIVQVNDPQLDMIIANANRYGLYIKSYESGFTILDFESSAGFDEEVAFGGGIGMLLMLLLSIATMIFAVLTVFCFKNKTAKKILKGFAIASLVFTFLYMLFGIILTTLSYKYLLVYDDYWRLTDYSGSDFGTHLTFETSTLSYLGFIFGASIFVAYILCLCLVKDDLSFGKKRTTAAQQYVNVAQPLDNGQAWTANGQQATRQAQNNIAMQQPIAQQPAATQPAMQQPAAPRFAAQTEENSHMRSDKATIEILKEYKGLLDAGIITQDEFDAKKRELL